MQEEAKMDQLKPIELPKSSMNERLSALSSVDGRYCEKTDELRPFCSEAGLQHLRTIAEVEWLRFFCSQNLIKGEKLEEKDYKKIKDILLNFNLTSAQEIKLLEKKINHDVKSVEIFIANYLKSCGLERLIPFVHILLTSEDITNVAYAFQTREVRKILMDNILKIICILEEMANQCKYWPMLSHTHGQPASPTTVGKEFMLYAYRLKECYKKLRNFPIQAKWNGATGNFNAHKITYPNVDWPMTSEAFVTQVLGFEYLPFTAQTSNYAYLADILHMYKNVCAILKDLSMDHWLYISMYYFGQKPKSGEVGSSTMPHKINPIDFENAEGNLGITITNLDYMAGKIQQSRLQRDLSDSTTLRFIGTIYGHMLIGFKSVQKGLEKLTVNKNRLRKDLVDNPAIISEAIQMILRKNGILDAYDQLKEITRGQSITLGDLYIFIKGLQDQIDPDDYQRLIELTPEDYTGCAAELVTQYLET